MNERARTASFRGQGSWREFSRYVVARILALTLSTILVVGEVLAAIPDVCGSGVGSAGYCPGRDADRDSWFVDGAGPNSGTDCDDNDRQMYPGVWKKVTSTTVKQCQSNGTYGATINLSAITCNSGSGQVYFFGSTGNNANVGSYNFPWRDYQGFSNPGVAGYHPPAPGDCFVALDSGPYNSTWSSRQLYLNNKDGTSSDKITIIGFGAEITGQGTAGTPINPIDINGSDYVVIDGLGITGGFSTGAFSITASQNVEVRNSVVHNVDGDHSANPSCFRVNELSNNTYLHHNVGYDCYDVDGSAGDQQNNRLVTWWESVGGRFEDNVLYFSNSVSTSDAGPCIWQKHSEATTGGDWTVKRNILENCNITAIATSGGSFLIDGNMIVNVQSEGYAFEVRDLGQTPPVYFGSSPHSFINNTVVDGSFINTGFTGLTNSGTVTFSGNVISDDRPSYATDTAFLRLDHYSSNASFTTWITGALLSFSNNCYWNSSTGTLNYDIWGDVPSGASGSISTTLSGWKTAIGSDSGTFNESPAFNSAYIATSTNCAGKGAFYQGSLASTLSMAFGGGALGSLSRRSQ